MIVDFQVIEGTLAELPEFVAEWEDLGRTVDGQAERAAWALEWDHMMLDRLTELADYAAAAMMNEEQRERLGRLLRRLHEAIPMLMDVGLCLPPGNLPGGTN